MVKTNNQHMSEIINNRITASEGKTVEFKTSLFYKAGLSCIDSEQLSVITRTIAAFMNAEGGKLYIGVNDNGVPVNSVDDEYQYMSQFPPFYGNKYSYNEDGYRRFILDWVAKLLGNYASLLVSVDFVRMGYVKVCVVTVKKSKAPVWFDQTELYVRADASNRRLRGNDITNFFIQMDPEEVKKKQLEESNSRDRRLAEIKSNLTSANGKLLVVYPNGDFIHGKNNVETMLEVIHRAGVKEVASLGLTGRKGKGSTPFIPFIGTVEYFDNASKTAKTQSELDGYLVFKKYAAGDIVSKIVEISNGLGLQLHVEVY